MGSATKPGVAKNLSTRFQRVAVYPVSSSSSRLAAVSSLSPASMRPAGNSHKDCSAAWRYWRSSRILGWALLSSSARMTTDPGVADNISANAYPGRLNDFVGGDPENRPAIYLAGGEHTGFSSAAG